MPKTTPHLLHSRARCPFRAADPRPSAAEAERAAAFHEEFYEEPEYSYSNWYLEQGELLANHVFRAYAPQHEAVFLDVGCALGGTVRALRERGYEAYGIDISPYCLSTSPMKEFLTFGFAHDLPCTDASVDYLFCFDTFQYLSPEEVKRAAREFRRVTRKYVCFEAIDRGSAHADQVSNSDAERRTRDLCSAEEYRAAFLKAGFSLITEPFLPQEEEGYAYAYSAVFAVS